MRTRLLVLLAALSLLAAACGGDDGTDATDTPGDDGSDTEEPTGDDEGDDADDATDDESEADDGTEDGDDAAPDGPLTASFRGVTETEIKVGIGYVDASDFGFDIGDIEAQWQAAIDRANDAGGINGRMLAPIFSSFSPVGAVEAEEVCLRFTEDEEVFAFIGFVREDNELCYTELHETIAVNTDTATIEAVERSNGLLFTADATRLGLELLAIDAAAADGLLDGATVHINSSVVDEPLIPDITEALEAAGATVTGSAVQTSPTGDIPAVRAEHDLIVQRADADGADTIYAISDIGLNTTGAVERSGLPITIITSHDNADTYVNFGQDPSAVDLRVFAPRQPEEMYEDNEAGVVECVENYEASSGNTVNVGDPDAVPNNFVATLRACRGVDLFTAIATAAGPDLTNESFVAAAASLGSFDLTAATEASMEADKVGADDTPAEPLVWDSATLTFVPA